MAICIPNGLNAKMRLKYETYKPILLRALEKFREKEEEQSK